MVFSSIIFLFFFLPLTLSFYFVSPRKWQNFILLLLSLIFYAWGETFFVWVMLFSIGFNYSMGLLIDRFREHASLTKLILTLSIVLNLGLLGLFKYANFVVANLNTIIVNLYDIDPIQVDPIHLPIGISFFTFQAISYVIDVYRRVSPVQRKPINMGLYIGLFPQLIAGPIVRYHDIADQIDKRAVSFETFSGGVRRFAIGLGKKVLIANTMATVADQVFTLDVNQIGMGLAWLGIICYSIQIYFDFSGYSDMAIGLGLMFGFRFLENFNYPYISTSIREFWRRWHISLSNWFRDYLYIPLGGNRKGSVRTYVNLYLVFFLTGLWHGASWNFVIWGLIHGTFMIIERLGFDNWLHKLWRPLRHAYVLLIVMVAWVFFRAETFTQALGYITKMFSFSPGEAEHTVAIYLDNLRLVTLLLGLIFSVPILNIISYWTESNLHARQERSLALQDLLLSVLSLASIILVLFLSVMSLASGSHNPFIYFRF